MRQYVVPYFLLILMATGCDSLYFAPITSRSVLNMETVMKLKANLTGYADSSLMGNFQAIGIDPEKGEIILSLPAPNLFQNWQKPVPQLEGAYLRARVTSDDKSSLVLHFPLTLLGSEFKKFGTKSPLPNGQSIPGVPSGKLYSQKIPIDQKYEALVLFDKGIIALLLNVPYDPMIPTSIPIKKELFSSNEENILGFANTIPKGTSAFGGLLISAIVPHSSLKLLENK